MLLSIIMAFSVRFALEHWLEWELPFALLLPAVLVSAWFGGARFGLVATLIASIGLIYADSAEGQFALQDRGAVIALIVFGFEAIVVCLLCEGLHLAVTRADAAAREAADEFELLANSAPVLIWVSDVLGRCVFVNRNWQRFTGRSLKEELGGGWRLGVHPDDLDRCQRYFADALRDRRPYRLEYRLRRRDNAVFRWMLEQGVPRYGRDGQFEGYIGSCVDSTDARREREELTFISQLQHELAASLDLDRTAATLASALTRHFADTCIVDLVMGDGSLRRLCIHQEPRTNDAAVRRLNQEYPPDLNGGGGSARIMTLAEVDFVPEVGKPAADRADLDARQALERAGFRSYLAIPLRARDRIIGVITTGHVTTSGCLTRDHVDLMRKVAGAAALAFDNALLHQHVKHALRSEELAREQLERSERRFRSIWEANLLGIIFAAEDGRVVDANDSFLELIGATRIDLAEGRVNWRERTPPEWRTEDARAWMEMRQQNRMQSFEKEFLRPDGSRAQVLMASTFLPNSSEAVAFVLDVSARKQAEQALERSERRYRTIATQSSVILWTANEEGRILDAPGWEDFTGEAVQPTLPTHTGIHPDDKEAFSARWVGGFESRAAFEIECRLWTNRRAFRHVRIWGSPISGSTPAEWVGTITDIHDRKEAEQALRRARGELQLIMDAMPALIAYVHRDFRYGLVNRGYGAWFGRDANSLRGKHVSDLLGQEVFRSVLPKLESAMRGETVQFEMLMNFPVGPARWINAQYIPHYADDGSVVGCIALIQDVTARKRSEQELADALARYRFLAEAMPQMVWTAQPNGRLDYVNERWSDYTGVSLNDAIGGQSWEEIIHPDDRDSTWKAWRASVTANTPFEHEHRLRCARDSSYRWHLSRALPRQDAQGQVIQWVGSATDIDERRRAFAELDEARARLRRYTDELELRVQERTTNLQELNAELEAFSYSVSHDLRTPLQFIQGFAEAVLEDGESTLSEDSKGYVRRVIRASQRMDTIVRDLLTYSRVSREQVQLAEVDLAEVIEDVMVHHEADIKERHALIEIPSRLPIVRANRTGLFQALSNLVANALKFVSPDRRPEIRLRVEMRGERIRLWVEDNGIGISPEHHEKIFRLFERLHSASEYPGTGVGLSLVKKAMAKIGGGSGMESVPGEGSRFWIEMPAVSGHDFSPTLARSASAPSPASESASDLDHPETAVGGTPPAVVP